MKKILFVFLSLMIIVPAASQTQEETPVRRKEKKERTCPAGGEDGGFASQTFFHSMSGSSKSVRTDGRWKSGAAHWSGVTVFYNGLVKNLGSLKLPAEVAEMKLSSKSIGVDVNLFDFVIVSKGHFGLFTGVGMEFNNFRFDNNIGLTRNDQGVVVIDDRYNEEGISLEKSKLTTGYVNIPLMAEFQFGGRDGYKRRAFVNFGVIGGVKIASHTKIKSSDEHIKGIRKTHGGLNLREFHYGFAFNIGYRFVSLSAKYYPCSIFTSDGGPNVQQVNIGIGLLF